MLNAVLEDGEPGKMLIVLRQMTKAFGGVQAVAERAELNSTQIYRTLSAEGNPSLSSFTAILKAMGMWLEVKSIEESPVKSEVMQRERKKPARTQGTALAKVKAARG